MTENTWRRSSFSRSEWDVSDKKAPKRGSESFLGVEHESRPPLEPSIYSAVRNTKRSRCSGHPSKKLSDTAIRQGHALLESRRFGASLAQRGALVQKTGPCLTCCYAKDRAETASAALGHTLRQRNPEGINTILRTTQIIAAACRPMTLNELDFAINTKFPSPHYFRNGAKPDDDVRTNCGDDKKHSVELCRDLLKFNNNEIADNGLVEFSHRDMRNLISSVRFRQNLGLPHEDEILTAICIQHLGCHGDLKYETASTSPIRCPVAGEGACALREYAISFWKEHYLRTRGGSQLVHSLLHETMVSALSRAGNSENWCQRGCNDLLATGMEMSATHDLPVIGRAYVEMGAGFNQCYHSTHTPLHTAAANSSSDMIKFLLGCGADPNAFANDIHESQTYSCSTTDACTSTALALFSLGHDQCHCWRCCNCFSGRTPLHLAAATGQEASMRNLVAGGADINLSTKRHGDTALHLATRAGRFGIVQFLVTSGAEIGRQNSGGATALHFAKSGHNYLIAKLLLAAAPPMIDEPAVDAIYVEARHDREQSTSPVWRMRSLTLEDTTLNLSGLSSKNVRDTTSLMTFSSADTQTSADNKEPVPDEDNWILIESSEVLVE